MNHGSPQLIGIAIVEHNGCYLVGQRQTGQALEGLAEFPGGKCELDEKPQDCVVRECREETGINVLPVRLLDRTCHEYAHAAVDLHFWLCRLDTAPHQSPDTEPKPINDFHWQTVDELRQLSFPEANARVVELLSGRLAASDSASNPSAF